MGRNNLAGDIWGGLAATLVALPASIAFGVAVYTPLGGAATAQGALAGLIGAAVIGIVAPLVGGTARLVSAPCAPAAAVMGAFSLELVSRGLEPSRVILLMMIVALISGGLQVLYGLLGGGTLIKYIPYPVVTGYLSGVGVVIFLKQMPGLLGLGPEVKLAHALREPATWSAPALVVGAATMLFMVLAPRWTKTVPPAIIGLAGGCAAYFALAFRDPALLVLEGNRLLIGPLAGSGASPLEALTARLSGLSGFAASDLGLVVMPALTLSALLSIDTLKTCVVVDALTRSRHDSNREMRGQGVANVSAALLGGMPGAGTSGPTLVNIASGGHSRLSGLLAGAFALIAYLLLARLVAWTPLSALAGILIVVAWRMFDKGSFRLLRQRSTILDFFVVASVIAVAVGVGLIAASGTGVALAIMLFIRDQIRGTVIHRKVYGNQLFSRQRRLPEQLEALKRRGGETVVCELEGNLFFGTTDQLLSELEADLRTKKTMILDLRRVRSLDLTAAHLLEQMSSQLEERRGHLLFSNVPKSLPSGQDLRAYFDEVGLVRPESHVRVFGQLSDALEWAEDQVLEEEGLVTPDEEPPLEVTDIDFMKGRKPETARQLAEAMIARSYAAGETIFRQGDAGDEIFLVRRGTVRIALQVGPGKEFHVATFGRGDFFGDMAFLDRGIRSADALAQTPTDLFVLSRERFDALADKHPRLGQQVLGDLALALARRLRHADAELRVLEEA
ncbi:MAG: SulP family inorganic anion transporter [Vicinamibacteria bacterium]|nr:SulP family inorganic anion transporter [Vicinamibacteria bacterium]